MVHKKSFKLLVATGITQIFAVVSIISEVESVAPDKAFHLKYNE